MISNETIERIFETARIEEVIGDFVTLKKAGSNLKGLSPFSNEKTPSFFVSPAKQIFKDFSSGKGGNVVSFLMEHEHYTYPEALRYLAKKYNIEVEETGQSEEQKAERSEKESLYLVNEFASRYFEQQLWKSEKGKNIGLSYFKERGFQEDTIKAFQLGYSHDEYEAFTNAALRENYQLEFLEKTGLTKVDGQRKTDRFRGRVMFPILSHTGRVLGFGGRTLLKEAKIAKYLNSPESEIYHKSKTLYGLFQAKSHLGREDECLLVEGYTDVISLHQAGVKNAVASSGTSLTTDQINLIKRYTLNVTILYDGDAAGIKASLRGIDMILEEGLTVNVLLFPEGEDPDSYAQKVSPQELKDFIQEEKTDFLRFKARLLLKEAGDNPLEKSKAAREMVQSIAIMPDVLQRDAYIKESARILEIDERILFSELAQLLKTISRQKEKQSRNQRDKKPEMTVVKEDYSLEKEYSPVYHQEKALCWLLLNYGHHKYRFGHLDEGEEETVAAHILVEIANDELEFENESFQLILQEFMDYYNDNGEAMTAELFLRKENQKLIDTVVDLVTEKYELHNWSSQKIFLPEKEGFVFQFTEEALLRFKEKRISQLIKKIELKLKSGTENWQDEMETLNRLNQLKIQINKELNRVV